MALLINVAAISLLAKESFVTQFLIGYEHTCQPIRIHVIKHPFVKITIFRRTLLVSPNQGWKSHKPFNESSCGAIRNICIVPLR